MGQKIKVYYIEDKPQHILDIVDEVKKSNLELVPVVLDDQREEFVHIKAFTNSSFPYEYSNTSIDKAKCVEILLQIFEKYQPEVFLVDYYFDGIGTKNSKNGSDFYNDFLKVHYEAVPVIFLTIHPVGDLKGKLLNSGPNNIGYAYKDENIIIRVDNILDEIGKFPELNKILYLEQNQIDAKPTLNVDINSPNILTSKIGFWKAIENIIIQSF